MSASSSVQRHYRKFIQQGGEVGTKVWETRGQALGYDETLLPKPLLLDTESASKPDPTTATTTTGAPDDSTTDTTKTRNSSIESLFQASCGSGCPLRLHGAPQPGETVVDIGCGAGHDVLIASYMVEAAGSSSRRDKAKEDTDATVGTVVGVDFVQEMVNAAEENIQKNRNNNNNNNNTVKIDFVVDDIATAKFGTKDNTPLAVYENKANVVISNGVLNLCKDKLTAFSNIYQLLAPNGRFLFSDVCKYTPPSNSSNDLVSSEASSTPPATKKQKPTMLMMIGDVFSS